MKCVNIRTTAETILFDCPHCGLEAVIEDASMLEYWTDYEGKVTCPVPQGCNMQYEIPTAEEVEASRTAGTAPPAEEPIAESPPEAAAPKPEEAPVATAPTTAGDAADPPEAPDETDAEEEPGKPKFTGPFRYVSKSEEEAEEASGDEIEQLLGQKEEDEEDVNSPLMIRTFRRLDCIVQGKNKFDDVVSRFLGEVGRENVISVTPMTYTEKSENVTDYGVIIYYAQPRAAPAQPAAAEPKTEPVAWRD